MGVFLAIFVFPVAVGLLSIFFPLPFAAAGEDFCARAAFLCTPANLFSEEAVHMASLGYGDYGVGLQAFRRIGIVLTLLGAGAYVTAHFAFGAAKRKLPPIRFIPAIQPLDIPLALACFGLFIWWALFVPDIYPVYPSWRRGPPMGTIAVGFGIAFSSFLIGISIILGLRYTLLKQRFPPSGSDVEKSG